MLPCFNCAMAALLSNRRMRATRLGLAAGVTVCVVAVGGCGSSDTGDQSGQGNGRPSADSTVAVSSKPDFTRVSETLVVGRDSFPDVPGGEWRAPYMYEHPESAESVECGPMLNGYVRGKDSMALASLKKNGSDPSFRIDLTLPSTPLPKWRELSDKCRSFDVGKRRWAVTPQSLEGLPAWAIAFEVSRDDGQRDRPGLSIAGNYRGLVIYLQAARRSTGLTDADVAASVKLFTDQVSKLEMASA